MESGYRTPSPIRESSSRPNKQLFGESRRYMPIQPAVSNTYACEEPSTPNSNYFLPGWHGLPSPHTPSSKNEIDHTRSIPQHDNTNDGATSEHPDYHLESLETNVEKQSSILNYIATKPIRSLQSDVQMEGSCTTSLSKSSDIIESIEGHYSPLSSPGSTIDGSSLLSAPIQSQDVRQPSVPRDELPLIVVTASDDQAPAADQNHQAAEQDAELARTLDAAIDPPLRRSSRISKNIENKDAHWPTPVTKTATKTLSTTQLSTQPDNSIVAFEAYPIHFNGLPTVHSVDWQIQYPAGGSTHPSYPYPNLDPRLVFHEGFVPLSDGLPDLSRVSKLFLPLGWKHVTWSGLIPVAFDPYRQAFKLTPAGPLPLTSEELQQNGLHKYVPGGEQHPETPHLPKMMGLSDGSDGPVYNWEGVDWTLPWSEMNQSLDLFSNIPQGAAVGEAAAQVSGYAQFRNANTSVSHYMEAWDAPDSIIDLTEAWRWLREKEVRPTPIFVPTAGKTFRGTGIHRTSRKFKQPIPSLMAVTIANATENSGLYLVNQDTREFCPFRSVATPVHVNLMLIEDIEITLQELISFFPNHVYWRRAADRFCYAGLGGGDIANVINMTRCLSDEAARKGPTIGHQLRYETCEDGTRVKIERLGEDEVGYTAQGWTYNACELTDYPLLALAHGLLSLPEGEDAGPLTKLILWCRAEGRYEVLLSNVPALIEEAGIDKMIERVSEECPDKRMLARHMEALKEDRKRVLQVEKRKKRMAEAEEGRRKKKKKAE